MKNKITTTEIYDDDKEWLRDQKKKHNFSGLKDVINAIRRLLTRKKLEGELK